ncbi:MAG: hypothetical protein ABI396_14315 [Ktedonobacteraceae bacterium]
MFDFDYPKVRQSLGEAALRDPYPVWLLDPHGVFKATNLMAIWLWEMLTPEETVTPNALLGTSAFALLADMFERIPVDQNVELYTKQSAVVKRLAPKADESLYALFIAAMKADPQRADIYEQAEPDTEREWEYPLRMASPEQDGSATLLEFQVSTFRLVGGAGFLITCVPHGATLSVIEAQYNRLMKAYSEINYVYTLDDREQEKGSPLPESFTNLIRAYYPTIIQDSLWYIVQENKAHQLLVGDSVVGIHFFELFFAPQLKEWMGPIQETSAPRAIKYFEAFTARFILENAELHDDYEQMMQRLLHSPDFSNLLAISRRMSIRIIQPESDQAIFYTCRVILPWPYTPKVTLHFRSMVQYIEHGLLGYTDGRNYRVILVPENYETEIALIALHLFSTATELLTSTEQTMNMILKQFLWILAFVLTAQEDLVLQEGARTLWEPEEAFADIYEDLEAHFSPPTENALATVKTELQAIMTELDRSDKIAKDALLTLLHSITSTKPYLEQVTAFLSHELEVLAAPSHSLSV